MQILAENLMTIVTIVVILFAAMMLGRLILRLYQIVQPNWALIISGKRGYRVVSGGGTFVFPLIEKVEILYIGNIALPIFEEDVLTLDGVPIDVEAIIQAKVGKEEDSIKAAASRFLGIEQKQINETVKQTLIGHLRAIIATLSANDIYQKWEDFARKVREVSASDLQTLGFVADSFGIKKVSDKNHYYDSLGKEQIAAVQRDAAVAIAEAEQTTRQKKAAADLAGRQAEIDAETQKAKAEKDKNVQIATYQVESDTKRAEADMAYPLKKAAIEQELATKEGSAEVERQRQAGLAETQRIEVEKQKRQADVVIPAEAAKLATIAKASADAETRRINAVGDAEAIKVEAEAEAARIRQTRNAEAEGTKAVGLAEADANRAKLVAEAEGQEKLAAALSAQGQVNLIQEIARMAFDAQVRIAEANAQAMAGLGGNMKVVQFGGVGSNGQGGNGHGTGNALLDIVMQMPELASVLNAKSDALTGLDLGQIIGRITKAVKGSPEALQELSQIVSTPTVEHDEEPDSGEKELNSSKL